MQPPSERDLQDLPVAQAVSRRRFNPSLVWLIPLLAALIGGWLAVNAVMSRGPMITIRFSSGEGLEAGKTKIKYKDVEIGEVSAVTLSPDRSHILVSARLVKQAAAYLVDDSRFWVVRPRISGATVSGLGTLLSGAYIGMDVGKSSRERSQFVGLDEQPIITGDLPGSQYTLLAKDLGSLVIGSPVLYRRVPVGQVIGYHLTPDGQNVAVSVFVNRPYDAFINGNTRFWHASGIDVTLDANGLKLDTQSLASVALGGVAFDTLDNSPSIAPGAARSFALAADREQAMRRTELDVRSILLHFNESLRGLSVGAPVDYRGVVIGEVAAIGLDAEPQNPDLSMAVRVNVYPQRLLALAGGARTRTSIERMSLRLLVANGFRAQLRSANLLTGQLYVAFDYFPDAAKATLGTYGGKVLLPTVPGDLSQLQHSLLRIAQRVDRIPLDELSSELRHSLINLDATLQSTGQLVNGVNNQVLPQTLVTLQALQKTLTTAQQTLRPDSATQQDLRDALQQISAAARSVQTLSDTLERHPEALIRGKSGD